MPRYTKKFKQEMAFFLHPRSGYVTYNKKCNGCIHDCKQSFRAKVIFCNQYQKKEDKCLK